VTDDKAAPLPIIARYKHCFEDYLVLMHARRELAPLGRPGRYALWFAVYLATILFLNPALLWPGSWTWQAGAIVFGGGLLTMIAVLVGIDLLFKRFVYPTQYARLSVAGQPVEMTIGEDGFHWQTSLGSGKLEWSAVRRVVSMPDSTILFLSRVEGIVLPARAFASPQAYAEAIAFVGSRAGPRSPL
jgi:YcxB-like protein